MSRWPSGWGDRDALFDSIDAFNPEALPGPGPFIADHDLLEGDDHVAFHRVTERVFERRGVYDMTFRYNLARLNLDRRHPDAGFRYAIDRDREDELRAEFTPTTPFCPQSHTLTIGSFRAWNGEAEVHAFSLVKVRVAPIHHDSEVINERLANIEETFRRTGSIEAGSPSQDSGSTGVHAPDRGRDAGVPGSTQPP